MLKEKNPAANIVTATWDSLDGKTVLAAMERKDTLQKDLERLSAELHEHAHHHPHDEECDDENCSCHHHHHGHEHHHDHEHEHHHGHDEECDDENCSCHHHHHHDDHEHGHGCHEHEHEHHHHHHEHHHGHHHADEVFTSWGVETTRKYTQAELTEMLKALEEEETYGKVLRAKGIVAGEGAWLHFDYVPQEPDVRTGSAGVTGRLCVIGCKLNEERKNMTI